MARELKVPRLAESISEAVVVAWLKPDGATVRVDEPVVTLETDKAAVEIPSEFAGVLRHARALGDRVEVGDVLARVEEGGAVASGTPAPALAAPAAAPPAPASASPGSAGAKATSRSEAAVERPLSPAVRRLVEQHGVDPAAVTPTGPGGRVLKEDVQRLLDRGETASPTPGVPSAATTGPPRVSAPAAVPAGEPRTSAPAAPAAFAPMRAPTDWAAGESERAVPLSRIRLRIAERLVKAQQTAAILTTFNETDMSRVIELRTLYKESFQKKHGVGLGFMSFFVKASIEALKAFPAVNARIEGNDIVYQNFHDIGVAVSTERGLMVPVIRNADQRSFASIEQSIVNYATRAREGTIAVDDLQGGTFTITNGGTFGSLLSTPILNPPQSAILGMHAMKKRPVVIDDQIVIRPMMYLALSYDHRLIDGRDAVSFLVRIKECIENPERMMFEL